MSASARVAERRQQLVESGLELFGTRGVAAVGVGDVCGQAQLTKRYFYESFGSIEELLDAVLSKVLDELTALVVPPMIEGGPYDIRPALTVFTEAILADARLVRLLVVETHSGALVSYRERFVSRAVETWLAAVPGTAVGEQHRRFLAYAFVGAASELAAAWIDGRLDIPLDTMVATTIELYDHLVRFTGGDERQQPCASPGRGGDQRRLGLHPPP
ncbi:MAG: TetR/AcrR family transcriptional regulator [Acidimicrobiales bacterium]